jgi:subtilase family serine protease
LDGTGQIIELGGGFRSSDLTVYFQEIGVTSPNVSAVSVDHAGNSPTTPESDDGEVMLDLEVAGSVAPKAKFVVYFAPNNGDKGFVDAISAAIHDTERKPDVISISWGGPESAPISKVSMHTTNFSSLRPRWVSLYALLPVTTELQIWMPSTGSRIGASM